RLAQGGLAHGAALQGSALALPFRDSSLDCVYSIGCLHHTGDVSRGVQEIRRGLRANGLAAVMLYPRYSVRRLWQAPVQYARVAFWHRSRRGMAEFVRALYDVDSRGAPTPHTDFLSRREVRRLFSGFSSVTVESQNFDGYDLFGGRVVIPRERLLPSLGRLL